MSAGVTNLAARIFSSSFIRLSHRSSPNPHKKRPRSRLSSVTNGWRLLPKVIDSRSLWARRFCDVLALHTADLGGDANVSESERALLRRSACLIVTLEMMELKLAQGADESELIDRYQRGANTLRRLLSTLGLQRRAKEVTPSLGSILREDMERQRERS
jgi:hypothetical protein